MLQDGPDLRARRSALNLLRNLRDRESVAPIAALLEDPSLLQETIWALIYFQRASVVPALREYLVHPSADVRRAAVSALREAKTREASQLLVDRLEDADPEVQSRALHLLIRNFGAVDALPHLQRRLTSGDPDLQLPVLMALNRENCPEVWPWIRPLLRSDDADVRRAALELAMGIPNIGPKDELLELLQDPVPEIRSEAAQALACFRFWDTIPDVLRLLTDPSEDVRDDALRELVRLGSLEILPRLIERMKDPNSRVRLQTLEWLTGALWKEAAPAVAALLEDPESRVRIEAVDTLGRLGDRSQAVRLLPLILKPQGPESESAERLLGEWDLPEIRPRLIQMTAHPDAPVRHLAAGALTWNSPPEAGPTFLKLLNDPDAEVRDEAIAGVGRLNLREGLPALRRLLSDPSQGNVRSAAFALASMKDEDSLGAMLGADLADEDWSDLIERLGAWKSPDLVAPLERFLDADERHVQTATLNMLRQLRHPLATEAIRRVLRISGHSLRTACAYWLGRLEDRESIPDLLRLLDDPAPAVQDAAAMALATLGACEAIPAVKARFLEDADGNRSRLLIALARLRAPGLSPAVLRNLRREDPDIVREAITAAEALNLEEALPDLLRLSKDDDLNLRPLASHALIRLGDRGEIPKYLDQDARELHLLNRFRQPELWDRLRTTPQPRTYRGSLGQALKDFAADAGLLLVVNGQEESLEQPLPDLVPCRGGVSTLLDALEGMIGYRGITCLLDSDRLLLLPWDEATSFWNHWAKGQGLR
jgi:HEAT repeat protein